MEPFRSSNQLPSRLALTGFMGAGKSTVGKYLAAALNWPFVDLDQEIVLAQGCSISSMFDSMGESAFREIEHLALAKALQRDNIILALGGGALESEASRSLLTGDPATLLIYLEAPLEILLARCDEQQRSTPGAARRPVLEERDALAQRFQRRKLFYERAQWRIDTLSRGPAEAASEILTRWEQLRAGRSSPGQDDAPPQSGR